MPQEATRFIRTAVFVKDDATALQEQAATLSNEEICPLYDILVMRLSIRVDQGGDVRNIDGLRPIRCR
jgi:hypothetical protein